MPATRGREKDDDFGSMYSRARAGEREARAWLVERFENDLQERLRYRAGRDVARWNQTVDLSQSVWTTFFERLGSYPAELGEEELKGYLFKLAEWRIGDAVGKADRWTGDSQRPAVEPCASTPSVGPVTRADEHEQLAGALASLPDRLAGVLRLRLLDGRSTAETAAELGIAEVTVKQRLAQGKALLLRTLARSRGHPILEAREDPMS